MAKKTCLSTNIEVKYLAKSVGISVPTALAKIGTWMDKNSTTNYPTPEQLSDYLTSSAEQFNALESQRKIDITFDPKRRKDRASLLATLFSDELNMLQEESPNMNRKDLIKEYTPDGIFNNVRSIFEEALQDPSLEEYDKVEYNKILDNFEELVNETSSELILLEGIDISRQFENEVNMNEDTPEGESFLDDASDDMSKEEQILDGWQINWKFVSPSESLSQMTRAMIQRIERIGYDGNVETDDLGFKRYLDPHYVHATLIDKLRFMTKSSDMIPMLEELQKSKPWVKNVIDILKDSDVVKSQFYQDFRKDYTPYSVQKRILANDGRYKYKTIDINKPEGTRYLLDEWKDNYESSTILSPSSIYNKTGGVNTENVTENVSQIRALQDSFDRLSNKKDAEVISKWVGTNIESLLNLTRGLGIDITSATLLEAATLDPNAGEDVKLNLPFPIENLLHNLNTINFQLGRGKIGKDGERVDFENKFKKPYESIAKMISAVTENVIESSVYENGKSYYSHTVPSYLGKMVKNLKSAGKEFLESEFKQFLWFYKDGNYRNEWVREIAENKSAQELLDHKVLLNFNKSNYSDLDALDYTLALINEFYSDPTAKTAWYHVPILSDAPTAEFLRFKRYTDSNIPVDSSGLRQTYKDFIVDKMLGVALQEYDRIKVVRARQEGIKNGSIKGIKNFDTRGLQFQFIPSLNESLSTIDELVNSESPDSAALVSALIKSTIRENFDNKFQEAVAEWERIGLFTTLPNNKLKFLDLAGGADKQSSIKILENYFWNSYFAQTQIIQIMTTDLAYYKNIEDFQKRNKQIHSPALRLNTESEYGRTTEKTIFLKDHVIKSASYNDISTVLNTKLQQGQISASDVSSILKVFEEVNASDAQAYRSLSSMRAILDMSGQWTPEMNRSFERLKDGTWDMEDFNIVWQPKKPFLYTQTSQNSKTNIDGEDINIKVPMQNKNSEFLLLLTGLMAQSPQMSALYKFMEDYDIDVVQFESAVKVGNQGILDINNMDSKEITAHLLQNLNNPEVVHELPYEDYGIQQAVPEHSIDATQLFGTQVRKLITSDIMTDNISVNGITYTKQQWLDTYNSIIVENIMESFKEVQEIFSDPKEVERILLDEIKNNKRYGPDMIKACTLNAEGQFNIPLFDPIQSQRIQTLLNSIIKSRVTKQKIKGGSLVQLSNFGFSDDLNIVWNRDADGKATSIKYYEAYMPWYTRQFFEPLIGKDGQLDIEKVPDNLRELIGYRIPTEDKYSIVPIKIKGFLDQRTGGAIMLPAEITSVTGADFDIDKMYVMLPEFKVNNYFDREAFITDLIDSQGFDNTEELRKNIRDILGNGSKGIFENENSENIYKTWKASMDNYIDPSRSTINKVMYDTSKPAKDNSLQARNNMLIDLMRGILTNEDTVGKMINPGGFDPQKKAARIVTILQSVSSKTLSDKAGSRSIVNYLNSLPLSTLDKIANESRRELDILSPITQVQLHQQNMTAAKLIGIFANHNANHAIMQHTNVGLSAAGAFVLNGKSLTSLHDVLNRDNQFISKNNAGFLAAAVDAVKDPVLNFINLNTFTADGAMLLSRLGYTPLEVGLLLSQPIIVEMTNEFNRESKNGLDKESIIDNVINRYKQEKNISISDYAKEEKFSIDMLGEAIALQKEATAMTDEQRRTSSSYALATYFDNQAKVAYLFKRIMSSAQELADLTAATRADTQGGGAGPTLADTEIKLQKVADFINNVATNPRSRLIGGAVIDNTLSWSTEEELRTKLLKSPLPFMQAFYSLGLQQTEKLLQPYFPQFNKGFRSVVNRLRARTKTGKLDAKTLNNIYNDLTSYIMTNTRLFGGEDISSTRDYYVNRFPDRFNEIIANNPELADLEFIKRLKVIPKSESNAVPSIAFRNVGKLTTIQREEIGRDWASMLYMGDESRQFAMELFKYSFFRNGFAFGPSTFIHLAPTAIRLFNPEYNNALRLLLNKGSHQEGYEDFDIQYLLNHSDNRRLVPNISTDSSVVFENEDGTLKDSITVTLQDYPLPADKSFYYKRSKTEGISWFPVISRQFQGQQVLYYNSQYQTNFESEARYERVPKLGLKNGFIEYEYGVSFSDITSVIPTETSEKIGMREVEIDYDSQPDYEGYSPIDDYGTSPEVSQENEEYERARRDQLSTREEEAINFAYQQIYNEGFNMDESLPSTNPLENFDYEQANRDFLDEEGNPLC